MRQPPKPPLESLRRQIHAKRVDAAGDGFLRQSFTLPREEARAVARRWFDDYPKAAYWTEVESWRLLPGDVIAFTLRRLKAAD
jgi:hypothetical protein